MVIDEDDQTSSQTLAVRLRMLGQMERESATKCQCIFMQKLVTQKFPLAL